MRSNRKLAMTLLMIAAAAATTDAATVEGFVGDGMASVYYDAETGEVGVLPDGEPVGIWEITSATNIFTGEANLPAGGIGIDETRSAHQRCWAALPARSIKHDFSLGVIAPAGLQKSFLLGDLTLRGGGGLGLGIRELDLVYFSVRLEPATIRLISTASLSLVARCTVVVR